MEERSVDRLARYIMIAIAAAIIVTICWTFKTVLIYIVVAAVISLISKPIMRLLQKITIKGKKAPQWLLAVLTLALFFSIFICIITLIIPAIGGVVKDISMASIGNAAKQVVGPLSEVNAFLTQTFPSLGADFRIEHYVIGELQNIFDLGSFSNVIGSAASAVSGIGVAIFSIVFISFFFVKDDNLFTKILMALVPDKYEKKTEEAVSDIGRLLSRYFTGVFLEVLGVATLNFLGLLIIARLGFNASIGIAFITGILNIIPYVGPLAGGVIGTVLGLTLKYFCATPIGLDVNFWAFALILIGIFCVTQLVDNFFYQPVIYSSSIRANPLEIFIVLLIAGHIGGALSMIIAIPCYTVIRVIAYKFFGHIKAIQRLIPDKD